MALPITWDKKSRKFLRMSGVTVPVSAGSASVSLAWYGNSGENFENRPRRNQVGEYQTFSYTTSPLEISKSKVLLGLLNGEGSTWNFEEGYGWWSESGHWLFGNALNLISKREFNFASAGYLTQITKPKFGNYAAKMTSGTEPLTTVKTGENGEWTVFCFYASTPTVNGPHRYLWFSQNSEGEKVFYGFQNDAASVVSAPFIPTSQSLDGISYIKQIVTSNHLLDNYTVLPFVVKPEELKEIFKHSSQWDMRWGFSFENGFDEPVSNCMINNLSSGVWDFNDSESSTLPAGGLYVLRFLSDATGFNFKNQGDMSSVVAGSTVSDNNFFARPRSFGFWLKLSAFPVAASSTGKILIREDIVGGLRGFRITIERDGSNGLALHCTTYGLNSTTAAQETISVSTPITTSFTTPSGTDTWVHFIWTLERKYNGPTDIPTEARLYKDGLLVDTFFDSAQEGDCLWDGNPAAAIDWTIGAPAASTEGIDNAYLKNLGCYGWHFTNEEAMELYRREAGGATLKFPKGFTPAPNVDFFGSSVGHDPVKVSGSVNSADYLGAYKGVGFKNNLQTISFEGSTSEVRKPPKPSTLLVPHDAAALPGNPFTTRTYPGSQQGVRPSVVWVCNSDYNTSDSTSINNQFYTEGPLMLCGQNRGTHVESSGPECFGKSYFFENANHDWRMDGLGWPSADVFNTCMGNLFLGKQAATVMAWIRPNTLSVTASAGAIWRTSSTTAGASKFRLDILLSGGLVRLRVGGRSDAADSFHSQIGPTDLSVASSNGTEWIQVGGIIDLQNNLFYEIVNGVRTSIGAVGAASTRFDSSTGRTQIGSDSSSSANSFIYQVDLYTKVLSEEECSMVYHRDLAFFRHNTGR